MPRGVPSIELKRHYRELPAEDETEVVETIADLIVNFIKARSGHDTPDQPQARHDAEEQSGGEGLLRAQE